MAKKESVKVMDEFKKVDKKLAEEFAAMFFGRKIEMVNTPLDEFAFEEGVLRFNVFKNYGREGETAYPFEFPFGQLTLNGYVIAGVLFAKDKKGKKVIEFIKT